MAISISGSIAPAAPVSKARLWTGRILSTLAVLFLAIDGVMKLIQPEPVVKASTDLGIAPNLIAPLGILLLVCTALYAVPRTAVFGALLLTGYLGGACATNLLRTGLPFNTVFPVIFGVIVWAGLVLRDPTLLPTLLRRPQS